jgi:DNA-binding PadR family transcriptional regulator
MSDMDISRKDSSPPVPLKPAVFHILLALAEKDRHGYAVMAAVRERSGGQVPLRTGSFYRHLAALMDEGLVAEAPARRQADDPRRGAYYRLTPRGREVLAAEERRLTGMLAALHALKPRKATS